MATELNTGRVTILSAVSPEEARGIASDILTQRRFGGSTSPRPFKGLVDQLDEWLRPIGEVARRIFDAIARHLPGGRASVWSILGGLVIVAAAIFTLWLARRRVRVQEREARWKTAESGLDPSALESAAEEAESAGELELAIRLRFRAGLLRLDRAKVIDFRESITSYEVGRVLRSASFEHLARDFDEVVYGRREPRLEDVALAREEWGNVLAETGRR
jgi:hypothetical protein